MPSLEAYLDDFGKVTVYVDRNYYGGHVDGFYLSDENGMNWDLVIRHVEEQERRIVYDLVIPAEFNFGVPYWIHNSKGLAVPLMIRYIVNTDEFDRQFTYEGQDLGAVYTPNETRFNLWAPTAVSVFVKVTQSQKVSIYPMTRSEKGVYRTTVKGNLENATYVYIVNRNGVTVEATDPYALSSTANNTASAVINLEHIRCFEDTSILPPLKSPADAILYEINVRDLTSREETGSKETGTYNAFHERGTTWNGARTGFDYLCSLGITHVQLQPVLDYATVDELRPRRNYNWGYDPSQIIGLEGSYSSNPKDPYSRMIEFKKLVLALHENGIRVNLDVVYNHMFGVDSSALHQCVPYYYFRYNKSGYLSNGSFCGNDLNSKRPMMKHLLRYAIRFLMEVYGVDGFRFDLMGVLDVDTMNELRKEALRLNESAMMYGEGWDLPTDLPEEEKAKIYNQHQMPGIGHFNDTFRDVVKGATGDDQLANKGFLTGGIAHSFDMCGALSGNSKAAPYFWRFDDPIQSVNGVETHDNSTLWDKMHACCSEEPREVRKKRQKMCIAAVLFAQGIPFLHAGIEFCATKQGCSNSYNVGDDINGMNWQRMVYNRDVVDYTRRCIAIRRKYAGFRLRKGTEVNENVSFIIADDSVVIYDITCEDPENGIRGLRVLFNPTIQDREYHYDIPYQVILDADGKSAETSSQEIFVPACGCVVATWK